jgi:hypothetical protein
MITQLPESQERVIGYRLSGTLHHEDYETFIPELETKIENEGPLRLLMDCAELDGADPRAMWDDLKFGMKHYSDVERMALVGSKNWHRWMSNLSKPFTKAEVRYFQRAEMDQAWTWLNQ